MREVKGGENGGVGFSIPGASVLGTVLVQELLFAIRTPDAHSWVLKLMPDWSILTHFSEFLSTYI